MVIGLCAMAVDPTPERCLALLKRRAGRWTFTTEVIRAAKSDPAIWDNHAAVIWSMSKLEDQGKISGGIEPKGERRYGWWIPEKHPETGDILEPVY